MGYESSPIGGRLYTHITRKGHEWWQDMISKTGLCINEIEHLMCADGIVKVAFVMGKYQPQKPWRVRISTYQAQKGKITLEDMEKNWETIS